MKNAINSKFFLLVIATIIMLLVSVACSSQNKEIKSILDAADALVMAHPEAALDTLAAMDDNFNLSRSDWNFYNLLTTEAKYKSYLPVAQDSAIFKVVDYYRKKGPDNRLVRALMMQGAVYEERFEPTNALESYKEAESIAMLCDDKEQMGILNSRIGEVYQVSIINGQEAVNYYLKSLECFKSINNENRIMHTLLALSRAYLLVDSIDVSEKYLKESFNIADKYADRICLLSGYELLTHIYELKKDYRSVVTVANEAISILGETPQNSIERDMYVTILNNCTQSYVWQGKLDSAKAISSKLPLDTQYDSLIFYSLHSDIASAEDNWQEAFEYQTESDRIADEMKQASYDAQLVEVEKKYENSVLREELYKRNNRILVLVTVFSILSLAAGGVFFLLRRLVRSQKAEIDRQTGIARKLHDTASRLELDLKSKASEADALKLEKQQEEDTRKELEAMLSQQSSSNQELMRYYCKARNAMQDIVNIYDARSSNPRHFMDEALEVARGFIMDMNSPRNAAALIDTVYPGFLKKISEDFPALQDDDMHLIALTCCGYPNGAVCTILGITESNLAVRKTRLARKMGIESSLAKYLRRRLGSWQRTDGGATASDRR